MLLQVHNKFLRISNKANKSSSQVRLCYSVLKLAAAQVRVQKIDPPVQRPMASAASSSAFSFSFVNRVRSFRSKSSCA